MVLLEVKSVTPRPGAFVSHGDLLEMKMWRFHSIPTESESLRMLVFRNPQVNLLHSKVSGLLMDRNNQDVRKLHRTTKNKLQFGITCKKLSSKMAPHTHTHTHY